MNHEYINEFNVIDQYALGHLTANEAEEFEDHYIDCPTCVEQLSATKNLVQDLKGLAVQETLMLERGMVSARSGWSLQALIPNRLLAAVAFGCIVVAGVLTFVAFRRFTQLEAELRQTQQAALTIRQEYQSSLAAKAETERQQQEAKQQLAQRVDELERKFQEDGRNQSSLPGSVTADVNFPIFALAAVVRGQAPPPTGISLPASSPRFALSIPVEDPRDFSVYRIAIVDQKGRTVWQRSGFRLDQYRSLSLSLSSNVLAPGTYDLRVEALTPPNNWNIVGTYPFRFNKPR
jgi:hypothetical protein